MDFSDQQRQQLAQALMAGGNLAQGGQPDMAGMMKAAMPQQPMSQAPQGPMGVQGATGLQLSGQQVMQGMNQDPYGLRQQMGMMPKQPAY